MQKRLLLAALVCMPVSIASLAAATGEPRSTVAVEHRLAELERQVEVLRAREAIIDLRHTYWFSLLDKDVDSLMACFTEDAVLDYGFNVLLQGKPAIRAFFVKLLGNPDLLRQIPRGANPRIALTGAGTATGRWLVDVVSMSNGNAPERRIGVQYIEEYRREAGGWKISRMKNDYLFFEKPSLDTEML